MSRIYVISTYLSRLHKHYSSFGLQPQSKPNQLLTLDHAYLWAHWPFRDFMKVNLLASYLRKFMQAIRSQKLASFFTSFYDNHTQAHCRWPTEHLITALSLPAGPPMFTTTFGGTLYLFSASLKVELVHLLATNQCNPLILFQPNHSLTKEDRLSLGPAKPFRHFVKLKTCSSWSHETTLSTWLDETWSVFSFSPNLYVRSTFAFRYFAEVNLSRTFWLRINAGHQIIKKLHDVYKAWRTLEKVD